MKPVIAMFDDFFDIPDMVFDMLVSQKHVDIPSDNDGITYPGINMEINKIIKNMFAGRLAEMLGRDIRVNYMFSRLMTEGLNRPHFVHSDRIMGTHSAHVYMSKDWPLGAGTGFYTHKTEGHYHSDDIRIENLCLTSKKDWDQNLFCQGVYNRLLVHDASYFHCAEPDNGFGKDIMDGRLVLTCFFNILKESAI